MYSNTCFSWHYQNIFLTTVISLHTHCFFQTHKWRSRDASMTYVQRALSLRSTRWVPAIAGPVRLTQGTPGESLGQSCVLIVQIDSIFISNRVGYVTDMLRNAQVSRTLLHCRSTKKIVVIVLHVQQPPYVLAGSPRAFKLVWRPWTFFTKNRP